MLHEISGYNGATLQNFVDFARIHGAMLCPDPETGECRRGLGCNLFPCRV
jgi:hypothetical protein